MCSPPRCTSCSRLRAWASNSRGAFATCSITKSGSSSTFCPSVFWPALANTSTASGSTNSTPISETILRQPRSLEEVLPPAPIERGHGVLGEDLVHRHPVDEHAGAPLSWLVEQSFHIVS